MVELLQRFDKFGYFLVLLAEGSKVAEGRGFSLHLLEVVFDVIDVEKLLRALGSFVCFAD